MTTSSIFADFQKRAADQKPKSALVLGSGMSDVLPKSARMHTIAFTDIPGLGQSSVSGHRGCISLGDWNDTSVLVFEGRLHFYEGHSWEKVVTPVQLAHSFGVRSLVMTNAAGGIHPDLGPGSLMAIRDHIEWTRPYCWRLPGFGGIGPDRPSPYSARLSHLLVKSGNDLGILVHQGAYASLTGPCYETPAEIRALQIWGADAVGMSTAREIQTGFDLGLECAALSCITNRAAGLSAGPLNHEEVLAAAAQQSRRLVQLLQRFVQQI